MGFVVQWDLNEAHIWLLEKVLKAQKTQHRNIPNGTNYSFAVATRSGALSAHASNIGRILYDVGLGGDITVEPVTFYDVTLSDPSDSHMKDILTARLHDRMTQGIYREGNGLTEIFTSKKPETIEYLDVVWNNGKEILKLWCQRVGTSLTDGMIDRLITVAKKYNRPLTDVECFAFAQANSEHCRHQTFCARWSIDGVKQEKSLMDFIKDTYRANPDRVVSAYTDNAAVFKRETDGKMKMLKVDSATKQYFFDDVEVYLTAKAETHNHPTTISPFPGAATGAGGEIRDEWAVGLGGKTAHGTATYIVSDSLFDDPYRVWQNPGLATPLEIMTQGPLWASSFTNEYGRPSTTGTFTAYSSRAGDIDFGFAKTTMAAGGIGMVEAKNAFKPKDPLSAGTKLLQIGGPCLRIGLGGASGSSGWLAGKDIDYSSVQRGNAEMQRRCQKVIDRCAQMKQNPILAIHDVWAGGIGNAFVELWEMGKQGAQFWLDKAPLGDPSLSAREIWSNEAQERYVLAVSPESYDEFIAICASEWVPCAWMGIITEGEEFHVTYFDDDIIRMKFNEFFYKESPIIEVESHKERYLVPLNITMKIDDAIKAVLSHPTVGDKSFLITIWDQTVGGLTTQNQMAGPWRVPVADVGVQKDGFWEKTGNAMVSAEALSLAPISPAASVRMAITEALTNLLAADISDIKNVIFSGNWMANLKDKAAFIDLRIAVEAASAFCRELGIAIPTGKDSFSMEAKWENTLQELKEKVRVWAPVVGLFTAFAPVADAKKTLTPYLQPRENTELLYIDLARWKQRMGGSILAQVHHQIGDECPDIDAESIKNLSRAIIQLKREGKILAYHDRSAGGLMATLSEMAFASHAGLDIDLSGICENTEETHLLKALFNQEAGIVIQISQEDKKRVMDVLGEFDLAHDTHVIARPQFTDNPDISVYHGNHEVFTDKTAELHRVWSTISDKIRMQRENPETVQSESHITHDYSRKAIEYKRTFDVSQHPAHSIISEYHATWKQKPKVAILRAPGTNGDQEMANKFTMAGFDAYDVNMNDLKSERFKLSDFQCLAACGGFSYGDTLGAGTGWAQSILCDEYLRKEFSDFFNRPDTASLGVCNWNQMMSQIKELIPGAAHFPSFQRNTSQVFESRSVDVIVSKSNAVVFRGMEGSVLPIVVSHGEWRAEGEHVETGIMQFVDTSGTPTDTYPYNPNGTSGGHTAYVNAGGNHVIMMPHPERVDDFDQIFYNLRAYAEEHNHST